MAVRTKSLVLAASLLAGAAAGAQVAGLGLPAPALAQDTAAPATPATDARCGALAGLKLANVEIAVAASLAEGAPVANSGLSPMFGNAAVVAKASAALCRVTGRIRPTAASDIGFEVWLPASGWDGRLHGIGIGGFAGAIDYFNLGQAVKAGQAGMATDTGHRGTMTEYDWAKGQPERVRDYNWRAVHLATVAAKQLVAAYYGRRPDKSYFVGCSGGGRQGLMQAARFPEDYDGILAGAPAADFTSLAMALINSVQAQNAPGAAIRTEQAKLLEEEVLRQCDSADGQADGLVADPRQCRFDAAKLACGASSSPQCFSDPQLAALRRIHAGPRNSAGRQLAGGYLPSGSEAGDPAPMLGWEGYLLRGKSGKPGGEGLADGMLGALVQKPFATPASFDWDKHPAKLKAASREIDAPVDLSRFFARGGQTDYLARLGRRRDPARGHLELRLRHAAPVGRAGGGFLAVVHDPGGAALLRRQGAGQLRPERRTAARPDARTQYGAGAAALGGGAAAGARDLRRPSRPWRRLHGRRHAGTRAPAAALRLAEAGGADRRRGPGPGGELFVPGAGQAGVNRGQPDRRAAAQCAEAPAAPIPVSDRTRCAG